LRATATPAGVALVYHRVTPEHPEPGGRLVPAVAAPTFEGHVRHLARHYRVVPAGDLPKAVARRTFGQRFPVAITFDDDIPSHSELAAPVLRRHGLPATFFLCGASLDGPEPQWWELLERASDEDQLELLVGGLAPTRRPLHETARLIEAMERQARRRVTATLRAGLGPDPDSSGLRRTAVQELARSFEIGFHTRDHDAMPALDDAALDHALANGCEELSTLASQPIRAFAYPHGKADVRVADRTRAAGFTCGYTTGGDAIRQGDDPLLLSRLDPSGLDADGFEWRLVTALLSPRLLRLGGRLRRRSRRGAVRFGSLRTVEPISRTFGFERGTPVDRYYIERFLDRHGRAGGDIQGQVLEIGDATYTRRFATDPSKLQRIDVLDIDAGNPAATFVGDLTGAPHIAGGLFDCIICTQTLLLVYDVEAAVRELHRLLAPGGVLLLTVPGISQICQPEMERFGDFWRFTTASVQRLLTTAFRPENAVVESYGNVLAATAFLYGLAAEELAPNELDVNDRDYQVVIAARAVKERAGGA
jgi:peptidoglycan/xylan/chitin deacetylase (PgdA/CDA1 family)